MMDCVILKINRTLITQRNMEVLSVEASETLKREG